MGVACRRLCCRGKNARRDSIGENVSQHKGVALWYRSSEDQGKSEGPAQIAERRRTRTTRGLSAEAAGIEDRERTEGKNLKAQSIQGLGKILLDAVATVSGEGLTDYVNGRILDG